MDNMVLRIVIDAFIVFSLVFAFAGVVGIIRMPDSFCRMQSSTNISTFGVLGVIIGGILYSIFVFEAPDWGMAVKLAVLGLFYIITNPISGHSVARAAYKKGVEPKTAFKCDKYGEDLEDE